MMKQNPLLYVILQSLPILFVVFGFLASTLLPDLRILEFTIGVSVLLALRRIEWVLTPSSQPEKPNTNESRRPD